MKEISISKTSIVSKLYILFYRDDLPNGLCPFFWKSLVAIILFIPYAIWVMPTAILVATPSKDDSEMEKEMSFTDKFIREYGSGDWGSIIGHNFLLWIAIGISILYIAGLVSIFNTGIFIDDITGVFWIANVIALLVYLGWLYNERIKPWWENRNYDKKVAIATAWWNANFKGDELPHDSTLLHAYSIRNIDPEDSTTHWFTVLVESVKGFYDKNCPTITWK